MTSAAPTLSSLRHDLRLYRQMLLVRQTELRLAKACQSGLVHGACHTYVGQEAIAVGVCAQLEAADVVFSTHRGHGHALAKGVSPEALIAELFGREIGCSGGRGGSMHLFAPEVGMMGTSGIVGPCILQAVGAGYSFHLLKQSHVAVAFFGDGAVNNGAFHEGLNLAAVWKLPVLFVCENNLFATEVSFSDATANPHVANRASAYGLPGIEVDGNDVRAVYRAAESAIARARAGDGPTLLECRTYRTRAHAEGMVDFTYRTREEVQSWKSRCPLQMLRESIRAEAVDGIDVVNAHLSRVEVEIDSLVSQAYESAVASLPPSAKSATDHVYSTPAVRQPIDVAPPAGARQLTYSEAALEALTDALRLDPTIFVMGEGIGRRGGNFGTTKGLHALYGSVRLRDTPICERAFVGLSTGAAMTGTRPVVDFMFADFILDAVGEILNQIAKVQYMSQGKLKMPVLLRGCIGIGHSAATHHSGSYYSMYAHFPGLRVAVPSTPYDVKGLLAEALTGDDPVLLLEHRELLTLKGPVPETPYRIPFGQAAIVRAGTDVTVVAIARMVQHALQAAEQLAQRGISVEIVDPRTIAPLDVPTIVNSVGKTGRLLIVDETFGPFGVGAEIAAQVIDLAFDDLDAPIRRLNGAHTPTPYSPILEEAVVPQIADIVAAIENLWNE